MNGSTDWVSAVAILASGLILGLLFVYFFSRRKSAPTLANEGDLERKDLVAKRDVLIQQLRELEPDADPKERARLERETAKVLKALDVAPATVTAVDPVPAGEGARRSNVPAQPVGNPALRGFLWGFGSFAGLAFLGWFVWQQASSRAEGGSVTGGGPAVMQQAQPQQDPAVMQLEAQVKANPDNLPLRNELAQAYLEHDNLMGVFEQTKYVLERKPDDSRALTFQALVRMSMGDASSATNMLQQAIKSEPMNLDARVGLAWVYSQSGKPKEAEEAIADAARISPKDKPRLDQILMQMKQQAQQPAAAPQQAAIPESGELPPGHPAIDGSTPAAAAAPAPAAGAGAVKITLSLDAGKPANGILYIMARNAGGGPPVAVKRIASPAFPMTVDLSSADSMMGQPLPPSFRLEARLDSDGDAMSKNPNDPAAVQENVAPGATVKLALK